MHMNSCLCIVGVCVWVYVYVLMSVYSKTARLTGTIVRLPDPLIPLIASRVTAVFTISYT